jgi:nucleoside-diphosphate-sugar epimerase
MSGPVAILGAGGFVGARMLEMRVLGGRPDVLPVVRAFRNVARNSYLGVRHRLGDASRIESLTAAFVGCETVVNLTMGEAGEILRNTQTIHAACVASGVRLLVHLSSAVVYGQAERPGIPDDAPPDLGHWMPYAREKGRAEEFLRSRLDGPVRVVVLRPGLVWGPKSPWVWEPAAALLAGRAYLVGDGSGLCNLIYVDNLVRSIEAVIDRTPAIPGFYHVADDQAVTWGDYYAALAAGLGIDMATVTRVAADRYRTTLTDRLDAIKSSPAYRRLKDRLPEETRTMLKFWLKRLRGGDRAALPGAPATPVVTRDIWNLQTTRYRLPTARFTDAFGHQNLDSFASGMEKSLRWLAFAGVGEAAAGDGEAAGERLVAEDTHAGHC